MRSHNVASHTRNEVIRSAESDIASTSVGSGSKQNSNIVASGENKWP